MADVIVDPEHLLELADSQARAAAVIENSESDVPSRDEVRSRLDNTHGVVCGFANKAIADAVEARNAAIEATRVASLDLAAKLRAAAAGYAATDSHARETLDKLDMC